MTSQSASRIGCRATVASVAEPSSPWSCPRSSKGRSSRTGRTDYAHRTADIHTTAGRGAIPVATAGALRGPGLAGRAATGIRRAMSDGPTWQATTDDAWGLVTDDRQVVGELRWVQDARDRESEHRSGHRRTGERPCVTGALVVRDLSAGNRRPHRRTCTPGGRDRPTASSPPEDGPIFNGHMGARRIT